MNKNKKNSTSTTSIGRKAFSPVDANQHRSRGVVSPPGLLRKPQQKYQPTKSSSSVASTSQQPTTTTTDSYADDSSYDFLSNPKAVTATAVVHSDSNRSHTLAVPPAPPTTDTTVWNSRSKTPKISNLLRNTNPTELPIASRADAQSARAQSVATLAAVSTKEKGAQLVAKNESSLAEQRVRAKVVATQANAAITTKTRRLDPSQAARTSSSGQAASDSHPGFLPPDLRRYQPKRRPRRRRRRNNQSVDSQDDDDFSIRTRGSSLETIPEDYTGEEDVEEELSPFNPQRARTKGTHFPVSSGYLAQATSNEIQENPLEFTALLGYANETLLSTQSGPHSHRTQAEPDQQYITHQASAQADHGARAGAVDFLSPNNDTGLPSFSPEPSDGAIDPVSLLERSVSGLHPAKEEYQTPLLLTNPPEAFPQSIRLQPVLLPSPTPKSPRNDISNSSAYLKEASLDSSQRTIPVKDKVLAIEGLLNLRSLDQNKPSTPSQPLAISIPLRHTKVFTTNKHQTPLKDSRNCSNVKQHGPLFEPHKKSSEREQRPSNTFPPSALVSTPIPQLRNASHISNGKQSLVNHPSPPCDAMVENKEKEDAVLWTRPARRSPLMARVENDTVQSCKIDLDKRDHEMKTLSKSTCKSIPKPNMDSQEPVDKQVWRAMMAKPLEQTFPIGIVVETPGPLSDDEASIDGSVLTQDAFLLVDRNQTKSDHRKLTLVSDHHTLGVIGRESQGNNLASGRNNKIVVQRKNRFGDRLANQNEMRDSSHPKPTLSDLDTALTKASLVDRPQHTASQWPKTDREEESNKQPSLSSIDLQNILQDDICSGDIPGKINSFPPNSYKPAVWSSEEAGRFYPAYGINAAPIFQLANGKYFQHPPLPPGWTMAVSRSKNMPFYIHPNFGVTFYSPVPLPSANGAILGATMRFQADTPATTLPRLLEKVETPEIFGLELHGSIRGAAFSDVAHAMKSRIQSTPGVDTQLYTQFSESDRAESKPNDDDQLKLNIENNSLTSKRSEKPSIDPNVAALHDNVISPRAAGAIAFLSATPDPTCSSAMVKSVSCKSRLANGIPFDINIATNSASMTEYEKFTSNLNEARDHRTVKKAQQKITNQKITILNHSDRNQNKEKRDSVPSFRDSQSTLSKIDDSETGSLALIESISAGSRGSPSTQFHLTCDNNPISADATSNCKDELELQANSLAFQTHMSVNIDDLDESYHVENTRSPKNVTASSYSFEADFEDDDFGDTGDFDSPDTSGQGNPSPSIPKRVVFGSPTLDDDMSHLRGTPHQNIKSAKISTRFKPTVLLQDSPGNANDDDISILSNDQGQLEQGSRSSRGSIVSRRSYASVLSSASRISHRSLYPCLPLCGLQNLRDDESEETPVNVKKRKHKKKHSNDDPLFKKSRRSKSVSLSSSDHT